MTYSAWVSFGFVFSCLWMFLPSGRQIRPFMASNASISSQWYLYLLGVFAMFVVFSWNAYIDKPNIFRMVVLLCFVGELASYMAFYNDPLFYIKRWRIEFEKPEGFFIPISVMLMIGIVLVINGFLDQVVFR